MAYSRLIRFKVLTTPLIGLFRPLGKHFGLADGFCKRFDGQAETLTTWTTTTLRTGKDERKTGMVRLQSLAQDNKVRILRINDRVHLEILGRCCTRSELQVSIGQYSPLNSQCNSAG